MKKKYRLPSHIQEFGSCFSAKGFECYLVGGAVRTMVAGHKATDWDFATDATPQEVMKLFRRVIPTGIKHGTVTVLFRGEQFEVTTFRIDSDYSDGRRPDKVIYTGDIYEDLSRRDFTINAMAIHIGTGMLIDPHNGKNDIKEKCIRAIGNPAVRFEEDGLRLLRACRFTCQLGFFLEAGTEAALKECRKQLNNVSPERIRDELLKMLTSEKPSIGFLAMEKSLILEDILPELSRCRGIEQKGFHSFDVLDHALLSCDGAPRHHMEVRLAALLHDIGKAVTRSHDTDGFPIFYHHDIESEKLSRSILGRLRFSNARINHVCHLIRHHMFHYTPEWSDAAVRRFIARVGFEYIDELFALRRADQYGMAGKQVDSALLVEFKERIQAVRKANSALSLKDLAIGGKDLIDAGIPSGPVLGTILDQLLETVLDDPSMNRKEKLIAVAKELYRE
jgi:tRNA nucleotidyltransferase (CCA-adding enzyme)